MKHYGVLGMKWGKRRDSTKSSSSRKKKNKRKIDLKSMSDDELRKKINRMQMEKQYSQLISDGSVSKGKKYYQKTLKATAAVATATTTGLTVYNNAEKIKKIIEKTK